MLATLDSGTLSKAMTRTADNPGSPVFVSLLWHTMAQTSSQDHFVIERGRGRTWDDGGFKTLHSLYWLPAGAPAKEARTIGAVKILQRGVPVTVLPERFTSLDESFCSLGQSSEYYERLEELVPALARRVLAGLRDIAVDPAVERGFAAPADIERSLLRSVSARMALEVIRRRSRGEPVEWATDLDFRFRTTLKKPASDPPKPYDLEVKLSAKDGPLGRMLVLVGKNATGKSGLLSALGQAVSGLDTEVGSVEPAVTGISRVIAIAYSAFDPYSYYGKGRPAAPIAYYYCGLRDHRGDIDVKRALARSQRHLQQIEPERWRQAIRVSGILDEEPSLEPMLSDTDPSRLSALMETLSSGHKIFLFVLANLLATIRRRSLVLVDEPEIHLHPNLLSSLMRLLHSVLDEYDSFAVVATHSPQVLQEVPARYVRIIGRSGGGPSLRRYPGESFGANLGEIVRLAFGVDERSANYFKILQANGDEQLLRRWYEQTLRASSLGLAPYTYLADRLREGEDDDATS